MRLAGKTALITGAGSGMGRVADGPLRPRGRERHRHRPRREVGLGDTVTAVAMAAEREGGELVARARAKVRSSPATSRTPPTWSRGCGRASSASARCTSLYNNAGIFPDDDSSVLDIGSRRRGTADARREPQGRDAVLQVRASRRSCARAAGRSSTSRRSWRSSAAPCRRTPTRRARARCSR